MISKQYKIQMEFLKKKEGEKTCIKDSIHFFFRLTWVSGPTCVHLD